MEENKNNNRYISVRLFIPLYLLIFTILLAIVGWFAMAMNGQSITIDRNRDNISEVNGDIKEINANIANISKSIDEIKNEIQK